MYGKITDKDTVKYVKNELDGLLWTDWKIPNFLYSPEAIFGNKIAMLDVNFVNPHEYVAAEYDEDGTVTESASDRAQSLAGNISSTIASWYKAFRNIAVVGLLSVLVYLGIRILIGSTAQDKAKYKERLQDWIVALCLVFAIHLIMSTLLMITEKVTEIFNKETNNIVVMITSDGTEEGTVQKVGQNDKAKGFRTNLTGYVRFLAQSDDWSNATAYTIIYLALVIYTVMFTFTYFKRLLYMAFFTMIAPLVALTYPIDKAGDGKAQAFNIWFKEYSMNAIIQPVHLFLYTALITSALDISTENPIYAIVAIAFLLPAEKFIKKMFGLDKAESTSGLGALAGGALALTGLKQLGAIGGKKSGGSSSSGGDKDTDKIRMQGHSDRKNLNEWKEEGETGILGGEYRDTNDAEGDKENKTRMANAPENSNPSLAVVANASGGLGGSLADSSFDKDDTSGINPPEDKSFKDKILHKASDINSRIPQSVKTKAKGIGKTAIRGVKSGVKGVWKHKGDIARTAAKVAGTTGGIVIGTAAGITMGDAGKAAQAILTGTTAGYAAGGAIANKTGNIINGGSNTLKDKSQSIREAYNEETYGLEYAKQKREDRENVKAKKEFMKNDEERRKYKDVAAKLNSKYGKSYNVDDVMKAAWDYKAAGVDEDGTKKGLELEVKRHRDIGENNRNHGRMINVMQEAGKYSQDYILDDKKRTSLENRFKAELGENKGQQVMDLMAEAHDLGDFYSEVKSKRARDTKEVTETDRNVRRF